MATDPTTALTDLVFAIARAEEAAQDAEDRGNYQRAYKIRDQARAMEAELAAARAKVYGAKV
jgi:hypothetical protein